MKRGRVSYSTWRVIVIGIAIAILSLLWLFRNLSFLILAASAVSLIVLFHLVDVMFDVRFKGRHYFFIVFIAVASLVLSNLYTTYPTYDKILHFIQPLMLSSIVLYMMKGLKLEMKWKLVFTFFVVTGSVGLFEIGEYLLDYFFGLNLQGVSLRVIQEFGEEFLELQGPLDDTMIDMMLGVAGSIAYIIYMIVFHRKK